MIILDDFGGESAPDLSFDQLKELKEEQQMATKPATTKRKRKPSAGPSSSAKPVTANARLRKVLTERELLPDAVFKQLGWDERITVYLETKKEIADMLDDEDFIPAREAPIQVGNFEVEHIGALRVNEQGRVFRVVKVEHVIDANAKAT